MAGIIDLGGERWKVTVSLGRDSDGRQRRVVRRIEAKGKREAKAKAQRLEAELRAGAVSGKGTFAEAVETWWRLWRRRDRSPATRQGYRWLIDNHILRWPLASRRVTELRVGDFDRWYGELAAKVSGASVQRIHAIVAQVLDQCIRDGALVTNPARLAHKPEVRKPRRPHTGDVQIRAIIAAAAERSPVRAGALTFAALTGLRRGELAGVRWSRLDLAKRTLIVELNVVVVQKRFLDRPDVSDDRSMRRHLKSPKGHQVAAIALDDQAAHLAVEQMAWQRTEADRAGVELADDPFLWQVRPPFDEPMWPDVLSKWMVDARNRAGHPDVRLHDLRHWQASTMLAVGATVEEVRERLRHRSLQTTMGYLEADPTRQRSLVARLPDLSHGG